MHVYNLRDKPLERGRHPSLEYQLGRIDLLFFVEINSYKIIYTEFRERRKNSRISLKTLVGAAGLEPATPCLEGGGWHVSQVPYFQVFRFQ
jgi:hypothetical protein